MRLFRGFAAILFTGLASALLIFSGPALGAPVVLNNATDVINATTQFGSDMTFNPAADGYQLNGLTNVSGDGFTYVVDGVSLTALSGSSLYVYSFKLIDGTVTLIGANAIHIPLEILDGGFIQDGGHLISLGGFNNAARGLEVENGSGTNGYIMNGGLFETTGGSGDDAYGAVIDEIFAQNGGEVIATGGSGLTSLGLWIFDGDYIQQAGAALTVTSGTSAASNAPGLAVDYTADFKGAVSVKASNANHLFSIVVANRANQATALTFGPTSVLTVYLNGAQSGSILVNRGDVEIQPGAQLKVAGLHTLAAGSSRTYDFLTIQPSLSGVIRNTFLTPDSQTLGFTATKSADNKTYSLSVVRLAPVASVLSLGPNGRAAIAAIESAASLPPVLSNVYDYMDMNSANPDLAQWAAGGLTPQHNAQILRGLKNLSVRLSGNLLRHWDDVFQNQNFAETQNAPAAGGGSAGSALWITPFYSSGAQDAKNAEFTNLDEKLAGVSLGYSKTIDQCDLGLAFHYVRGDYDASDYNADSDLFGLTLAARHRFDGNGDFWRPELSGWLGYSRAELNQKRLGAPGNGPRQWLESDPATNQWYVGLNLANPFTLTNALTLKPSVGLAYSRQSQESYRENGLSGLALKVDSSNYDSLLGSVGLEAGLTLSDNAELKMFGVYEHEFADKEAVLQSAFASAPAIGFETKSQNLSREQGCLGAELKCRLTDEVSASAGYTFRIADHYESHNVGLSLSVAW